MLVEGWPWGLLVMLTATVTYKVKVEVTTKNEKRDAKKASESNERKDCVPHSVNSEGVAGASQ
jgi:hypothetical protein